MPQDQVNTLGDEKQYISSLASGGEVDIMCKSCSTNDKREYIFQCVMGLCLDPVFQEIFVEKGGLLLSD